MREPFRSRLSTFTLPKATPMAIPRRKGPNSRGRLGSPAAPDLGRLDEADDVAVGVLDAGDQGAAAAVLDRLVRLGAGGEELPDAGVDVLDLPVADGAGEAAGVAVGIEAEALAAEVVLDVVG